MKINYYLKNKTATTETPIEFVIQYGFSILNEDGTHKVKQRVDKNGKSVTIHFYKRIKRSTGLAIKPKCWNAKNQSVRESFENSQTINTRLAEITTFINGIEKEFHENSKVLTIELLKEKLDVFFKGEKSDSTDYNFFSFSDYILEIKGKTNFTVALKQTIRTLKEFSTKSKYRIDFDTINLDFYDLYLAYLNNKEFAKNTIGKHIKNVKYIMNSALQKKIHSNIEYKNSRFKAQSERTEKIYLNDEEINKFYALDLSLIPKLERVKDLFLIGCYTGLRFSDFIQITSSNILNDILSIKTQKTGKYVKIPLRPEAIAILNKYNGNAPKAISNQKMNEYLKDIACHAGLNEIVLKYKSKGNSTIKETFKKYELVCTHTARRSFATNCYKAGIPAKQIMLITGHLTESEFFKYIQINEAENAEMLLNNEYFRPKLKVV